MCICIHTHTMYIRTHTTHTSAQINPDTPVQALTHCSTIHTYTHIKNTKVHSHTPRRQLGMCVCWVGRGEGSLPSILSCITCDISTYIHAYTYMCTHINLSCSLAWLCGGLPAINPVLHYLRHFRNTLAALIDR